MESASWFSLSSIVFLVVGLGAGAAAGLLLSPAVGEAKRLRGELDRLRSEHDTYRSSVNSHFRKTADLVGQMTKSYAAVYDHLAGGARRFCDDSGSDASIPFGPLPGVLASPVIETAGDEAVEEPLDEAAQVAAEYAAEDASEYAAEDEAGYADEDAAGYAAEDAVEYAAEDSGEQAAAEAPGESVDDFATPDGSFVEFPDEPATVDGDGESVDPRRQG